MKADELRFNSRRTPVYANRGMVASSQASASQAGLGILMQGGNAADAAVAMAAALNVAEPTSTGIGGDAFALFYEAKSGGITAMNASGRAPAALTIDRVRQLGVGDGRKLPLRHALTVTVPGTCSGWAAMLERHGTMSLADALAPAIRNAEDGVAIGPITAELWAGAAKGELQNGPNGGEMLIDGRAPRPGERFRNLNLAKTLRTVAEGGPDAFYRGEIARKIAEAVQEAGGVLTAEDIAAHEVTWETPISVNYRGMRVWECPPNGQGLPALMALNMLEELPLHPALSSERVHLQVEALKLAFADGGWYVADQVFSPAPLEELLSQGYAAERRRMIDPNRVLTDVRRGEPAGLPHTVYLCTVDGEGNACSYIQSNYRGFGTGLVPKGCGFTLQNRGAGFVLEPDHPNSLAPGKRPYHTIIPGLATRSDGSLLCPFGVMGGYMQPQGHVQVIMGLVDDGLDPQAVLDQPRFWIDEDGIFDRGTVYLEEGMPLEGLEALGHRVGLLTGYGRKWFGRGQIIVRNQDGLLTAGSDPRSDGCAMGF
jgi:gamma-glutamyltranspeptidase / glutathione hydrolase